ncbi:MAG TPA: hypothetical protein VFR86_10940 [Burkholderiaceae bacterium]|nr:hypothetical protein [Burkholderiaceae bacterium]
MSAVSMARSDEGSSAQAFVHAAGPSDPATPLPQHLSETGLFVPGTPAKIRPGNLSFSPQYALWSDGAAKRRWLYLPPGTSIDAARPNAWEFPLGTRLWKEFSHNGRPVETRFIERVADGSWRFAAYVWNEDGSDATLAPATGIRALPAREAPNGTYAIPSQSDCRACHEGAAAPVLGVSTLQLSPDRDPLAPHAERPQENDVDLRGLVARGLLRNLPPQLLDRAPRIATASPTERAALGYLHANCGHCHNNLANETDAEATTVPVDLLLGQDVTAPLRSVETVLRSMVNAPSRYRAPGLPEDTPLITPGQHDHSVLVARMRTRNPNAQMPPLGTKLPDAEGLALIERWINNDLQPRKEPQP